MVEILYIACQYTIQLLVGGFNPSEKYVKIDNFRASRGEQIKPPPSRGEEYH